MKLQPSRRSNQAARPTRAERSRNSSKRKAHVMKASKLVLVTMLAGAGMASIGSLAEDKGAMHKMMPAKTPLPVEGELSSLRSATGWLNSQPLTAADLRGKVVLIDFWTYTCINWLRTVPYVRAWAEKYKDQGLVVIGVHAPEFPFERNIDNVRRAAKDMNIGYPIAIDNDFAIWRAFRQRSLASSLFRRCAGPHATSSFRRGPVRAVGKVHSKASCRGRSQRHQSRLGLCRWRRR